MIHIALSLFLVLILFKEKFVSTKMNMNIFILLATVVFGVAAVQDVTVALLVAAISYVVISKIELKDKKGKEKFDIKKKVEAPPKPESAPKQKTPEKQKPSPPKEPEEELPKHCTKIGIRDDVLGGLTDKVDEYQTNTFDKYNMNVFYHESGSNSMDIQGIFNHEVQGYEKMN